LSIYYLLVIISRYYLLVYIIAPTHYSYNIHKYIIERQNAAGVVVDAEAVTIVAGQRASHPAAGSGQRGKDDVDEETRVRRRFAHNAHAGFQY